MLFSNFVLAIGVINTVTASPARNTLERLLGTFQLRVSEDCIFIDLGIGVMFWAGCVGSIRSIDLEATSLAPSMSKTSRSIDEALPVDMSPRGEAYHNNEGCLSNVFPPGYTKLHDLSQGNWETGTGSDRCFKNQELPRSDYILEGSVFVCAGGWRDGEDRGCIGHDSGVNMGLLIVVFVVPHEVHSPYGG